MAAHAAEIVMAQLSRAGLQVSLAPTGGLAVAPSSRLTAEIRDLVRISKVLLVEWLTAANDFASYDSASSDLTDVVEARAEAYYVHHFNCLTCIAAGRGCRYGQRCSVGKALWQTYAADDLKNTDESRS